MSRCPRCGCMDRCGGKYERIAELEILATGNQHTIDALHEMLFKREAEIKRLRDALHNAYLEIFKLHPDAVFDAEVHELAKEAVGKALEEGE